jgi:hypothetical protein
MASGHDIFIQFRSKLVLKEKTLTGWAAERGTGPQQVRAAVTTFAGSDRIPKNPISQKILADVYAELAEEPVLADTAD